MPIPETLDPGSPEIPKLKQREEDRERKGAGFIWSGSGASPIGSEFFGASNQGILGMGRLAATLGRALGGSSTVAGRVLLSKAGSWFMLAAVGGGMVATMATGAWVMTKVFSSAQNAAYAPPTLDGIKDSIKVQRPGNGDPRVRTSAGARFDDGGMPAAAPVPPNTEENRAPITDAIAEKPRAQPAGNNMDALLEQAKKADLSQLGKGLSAATGGAGTSAGLPNLQKQSLESNDFKLKKEFVPASNFVHLKNLTPFENRRPLVSTKEGVERAKSQRAIGQLKFARDMSAAGTSAPSNEAGKTFAADAFEQSRTTGGALGLNAGSTIEPPGEGAPDLTKNISSQNVTPYQNQVDQAQQDDGSAAALRAAGIAAIAAGLALLMAGLSMLNSPDPGTQQMGMMLVMAGIALILAGIAMLMMADKLGKKAKQQGNNINNQYGQQTQADTVNNCSSQAAYQGIQPQNCSASFTMPTNGVHQSVTQESQSTYNLDGGSPIH